LVGPSFDNQRCRGSSRQPRSFCFGKRTQNHIGRGLAPSGTLRGSPTPAARKLATLKQCAPNPGVSSTARPRHQARDQASELKKIKCFKLGLAQIYSLVRQ
jgi:hypothetical protein